MFFNLIIVSSWLFCMYTNKPVIFDLPSVTIVSYSLISLISAIYDCILFFTISKGLIRRDALIMEAVHVSDVCLFDRLGPTAYCDFWLREYLRQLLVCYLNTWKSNSCISLINSIHYSRWHNYSSYMNTLEYSLIFFNDL